MKDLIKNTEINGDKRINLDSNFSIEVGVDQRVRCVIAGDNYFTIPPSESFDAIHIDREGQEITVEDFSSHLMNMFNRWRENNEEDEQKRQSLIKVHQERILLIVNTDEGAIAYVLPKTFFEGETIGTVELKGDTDLPFSIKMFKVNNGQAQLVNPTIPADHARILHATQIIGHVKDGCDMQTIAHRKGTLRDTWNFAFPPTARTHVNQEETARKGVPTNEVTRSWSYAGPTDAFRSDFHNPESFNSVVGFVAANADLCLDIAMGKYAVVSTNFRSEGQLFKIINPHLLLGGINFTFLQGRPGERVTQHTDLPKFQEMLNRVQISLDEAPARIEQLGLPRRWTDDWWKISGEKMQGIDFILFRTFSMDLTIPTEIDGVQVIQIPHPIPEVRISKAQARTHLASIIGREIQPQDHIVLLPGNTEDGGTQVRIKQVIAMAKEDPHLIVITPMSLEDQRLVDIDLPENVFPIGFRDDWMDIIPAGDVTFLRGSWGEILDAIAAGNVPIITSPGVVPNNKDLGKTQFLTEVSGERASNLSLFIKELQKNGVRTDIIEGLLADTLSREGNLEVAQALTHALNPKVRIEIQKALSLIQRKGIRWMVDIHEILLDNRRLFNDEELEQLLQCIWSPEQNKRR